MKDLQIRPFESSKNKSKQTFCDSGIVLVSMCMYIWSSPSKKWLNTWRFSVQINMISHDYFTKNSMRNFKEPRSSLKVTKFAILSQGPRLWNKILDNNTKAFTFYSLF